MYSISVCTKIRKKDRQTELKKRGESKDTRQNTRKYISKNYANLFCFLEFSSVAILFVYKRRLLLVLSDEKATSQTRMIEKKDSEQK